MKKIIALLLTLTLVLALPLVFAAETEPLESKLQKQLSNGSGLKLSLAIDGGTTLPTIGADEATQALLQALLPGSTLNIEHLKAAFGTQKGRQELALRLLKGENELVKLTYRSDGTLETLSSPLLGDTQYAAATGESLFLSLISENGSQWPGIERILTAIVTADNEWKAKAAPLYVPYTAEFTTWLQRFTRIQTATGADGVNTTTDITLPAEEVKAEMKLLVQKFFGDTALLALLKEKMTVREANAYLDPAMAAQFSAAIDALPLTESIVIARVFGRDGTLSKDDVLLPMAGAKGLQSLHYQLDTLEDGRQKITITLKKTPKDLAKEGAITTLNYTVVPKTEGQNALQVEGVLTMAAEKGTDAVPDKEIAFSLTWSMGATALDRSADQTTAPFALSARVQPAGQNAHVITAEGTLSSGSNVRTATKITGKLSWQEEGADRRLTGTLTGASAAPWSIPAIDGDKVTRIDSMTPEQLQSLLPSIKTQLQTGFAVLLQNLLPAQLKP